MSFQNGLLLGPDDHAYICCHTPPSAQVSPVFMILSQFNEFKDFCNIHVKGYPNISP